MDRSFQGFLSSHTPNPSNVSVKPKTDSLRAALTLEDFPERRVNNLLNVLSQETRHILPQLLSPRQSLRHSREQRRPPAELQNRPPKSYVTELGVILPEILRTATETLPSDPIEHIGRNLYRATDSTLNRENTRRFLIESREVSERMHLVREEQIRMVEDVRRRVDQLLSWGETRHHRWRPRDTLASETPGDDTIGSPGTGDDSIIEAAGEQAESIILVPTDDHGQVEGSEASTRNARSTISSLPSNDRLQLRKLFGHRQVLDSSVDVNAHVKSLQQSRQFSRFLIRNQMEEIERVIDPNRRKSTVDELLENYENRKKEMNRTHTEDETAQPKGNIFSAKKAMVKKPGILSRKIDRDKRGDRNKKKDQHQSQVDIQGKGRGKAQIKGRNRGVVKNQETDRRNSLDSLGKGKTKPEKNKKDKYQVGDEDKDKKQKTGQRKQKQKGRKEGTELGEHDTDDSESESESEYGSTGKKTDSDVSSILTELLSIDGQGTNPQHESSPVPDISSNDVKKETKPSDDKRGYFKPSSERSSTAPPPTPLKGIVVPLKIAEVFRKFMQTKDRLQDVLKLQEEDGSSEFGPTLSGHTLIFNHPVLGRLGLNARSSECLEDVHAEQMCCQNTYYEDLYTVCDPYSDPINYDELHIKEMKLKDFGIEERRIDHESLNFGMAASDLVECDSKDLNVNSNNLV